MIRNIKHQLKLQELITKYAEKCNAEYDKQIVFFILIDNDKFRVYHNKGIGINGSELVGIVRF